MTLEFEGVIERFDIGEVLVNLELAVGRGGELP
jgi:hypothetical protein